MNIFDKLSLAGLVPVIKVEDANDAVPLCRALSDGGLPVAEITFRSAAAAQAIQNVHEALPDVMLGAGTVLTIEQVDQAVAAGATYIVSPGLNPKVVEYCVSNGIPILPGCANPSDIEAALSLGIKTVKFFPAEAAGGIKFIKAISAPYGGVTFVPTGGINENNALDYLSFPKVKAIGGSWMVPDDAIKQKDWARIESLTRSAVNLILGFEIKHIGIHGESPEQAMRDAKTLCALLGWSVNERPGAVFVGAGFELLKQRGRGAMGHIAIGTNSVERAKWALERRGFEFDAPDAPGAKPGVYFLKDDIAGFAFHLIQK